MTKLSELLGRIKVQLSHEWNTEERANEELEKMTVYEFLQMLEYMGDDD